MIRWDHRIGRSGIVLELDLADGRRFSRKDSTGVLNRLSYLPSAWVQRVGGPDRDYALQEMYAFFLSWLHSLPGPLLNPPVPQGLCGNWRHPSAWTFLPARRACLYESIVSPAKTIQIRSGNLLRCQPPQRYSLWLIKSLCHLSFPSNWLSRAGFLPSQPVRPCWE